MSFVTVPIVDVSPVNVICHSGWINRLGILYIFATRAPRSIRSQHSEDEYKILLFATLVHQCK